MYGRDLSRPPQNPETYAINRTPTEKFFTLFNHLIGISKKPPFYRKRKVALEKKVNKN